MRKLRWGVSLSVACPAHGLPFHQPTCRLTPSLSPKGERVAGGRMRGRFTVPQRNRGSESTLAFRAGEGARRAGEGAARNRRASMALLPSAILALAVSLGPALAQEYHDNVVIVLDASGSMKDGLTGTRLSKMNA